jgi:hypothetical protein
MNLEGFTMKTPDSEFHRVVRHETGHTLGFPHEHMRAELVKRIDSCRAAVFPDGMVWVSWPKKASGVETDVTEDVIRDLALQRGLVDVKVCAVDETWSALKLVIPVAQR